jgi:hypothetical protein
VHAHEVDGHADDENPAPQENCEVAAAAAHAVGIEADSPPLARALRVEAGIEAARTLDAPQPAWRKPSPSRAPPPLPLLHS